MARAPAPADGCSPKVFTVAVGKVACAKAEGYVREVADVDNLLEALAKSTK